MSTGVQVLRGITIALNVLMAAFQLWTLALVLSTEHDAIAHLANSQGLMLLALALAPTLAVIALVCCLN